MPSSKVLFHNVLLSKTKLKISARDVHFFSTLHSLTEYSEIKAYRVLYFRSLKLNVLYVEVIA